MEKITNRLVVVADLIQKQPSLYVKLVLQRDLLNSPS